MIKSLVLSRCIHAIVAKIRARATAPPMAPPQKAQITIANKVAQT